MQKKNNTLNNKIRKPFSNNNKTNAGYDYETTQEQEYDSNRKF